MRHLLVPLLLAVGARAVYVSITDEAEAYPLLQHAGSPAPLRWGVGELAALRLAATAVRVSDRGVRFVPAGMWLTSLGGWAHSPCAATTDSLCHTPAGTVLFPQNATAVRIPGNAERVSDDFARPLAETGCSRDSARLVVSGDVYTVSLCDVTQANHDFLLVGDTVHVRRRPQYLWFYLVVSVGTIVVVTSVAQNIAKLLGGEAEPTPRWLELGAAVLLVAVSWYGAAFVTVGDMIFYFACIAHVLLNTVYWWFAGREGGVPVNVLLTSLLLALCRMYDGIESEYIGPLLLLFLARAFHKAHAVLCTPLYTLGRRPPAPDGERGAVPGLAVAGHDLLFLVSQAAVLADFMLAGLAHQYGFRGPFARGGGPRARTALVCTRHERCPGTDDPHCRFFAAAQQLLLDGLAGHIRLHQHHRRRCLDPGARRHRGN